MFGRLNRGAAGFVVLSDPGGKTELETRMCSHCGVQWVYQPGSGIDRGFCMKCNGITCGSKQCDACVPYEARIEIMEGPKKGQAARRYLDEYLRVGIGK